jgi:Domain of unknown function (DUF4184)
MPWTLAHPAAVLPLRPLCPHRLSFGALVVGSVSPDIGYYVSCFDLARAARRARTLISDPQSVHLKYAKGLHLIVGRFACDRPP